MPGGGRTRNLRRCRTSNFRAFLVDGQAGRCLAEKRSSAGLRTLAPEQFLHYCREQLAEWRTTAGGSFLSGVLIGSKLAAMQPWIEAERGVVLVGSRELSKSYRRALEMGGLAVCQVEADRASIEGIRLLNRCRVGSPG